MKFVAREIFPFVTSTPTIFAEQLTFRVPNCRPLQKENSSADSKGSDNVKTYVLDLVRGLRPEDPQCPDELGRLIEWGPGPRAGQQLVLAAKARALLQGQTHVGRSDVTALALPVLRHRLVPSFAAETEGLKADEIVQQALALQTGQ